MSQPLSQIAIACQNGLPEGWTIFRQGDGVYIRIPAIKTPHPRNPDVMVGPDYADVRVDSFKDRDHRIKGGVVWYDVLLKAAEKSAKPAQKNREAE